MTGQGNSSEHQRGLRPAPARVVIIQEHLPHYRVPFFGQLKERLAGEGVELDLTYDPNTAENLVRGRLDWATPVPVRWVGRLGWQPVLSLCRGADLVIAPQEVKYLAPHVLHARTRVGSRRYALWGHGRNFQSARPGSAAERLKRWVSRRVDWWFAYNEASAEVVRGLGYPPERITAIQNTIDSAALMRARETLPSSEIDHVRQELGVKSRHIAIYCGGLYPHKRIEFLLRSADLVRQAIDDFVLLVIGSGAEATRVVDAQTSRPWLHYFGPKNDLEKLPYWALAQVLMLPGVVGLAVIDSFSLGVPMVTAASPFHGPEFSYVQDGTNGIVVPDWNSSEAYAAAVISLLRDPREHARLVENGRAAARRYTMENMVERFAAGVRGALSHDRYWP